jgi:hypothetical protein
MQRFDGQEHLGCIELCSVVGHPPDFTKPAEQLTTLNELEGKVHVRRVLRTQSNSHQRSQHRDPRSAREPRRRTWNDPKHLTRNGWFISVIATATRFSSCKSCTLFLACARAFLMLFSTTNLRASRTRR